MSTRASVIVGLVFVLGVGPSCGGKKPPPLAPTTDEGVAEVGKPAPSLRIQTVNGKGEITLDSLSGKIAVVDFWAIWCAPCKTAFPKLEELAKQNSGKVVVVGVSVDDKVDGVAEFAKANGATFPVGWDEGHTIAGRWKVETMPTTYILDTSGKVRFIHAGYKDGEADAIAKELLALSQEPSAGSASGSKGEPPAAEKPVGDKDKPPVGGTLVTAEPPVVPPPAPVKRGNGKKPGVRKPAPKPPAKRKPAQAP